jgi:dihydroflavonol-4-reductase
VTEAGVRVLVTGATGFLGSHVAANLDRVGCDVRVLVRSPGKLDAVPALSLAGVRDRLDVVAGDVTDPESCGRAARGCDAVVHAAALVALDARRAAEVMRTNVDGTRNVVRAALDAGASRVVYVSSVSVFGTKRRHVDLDSPLGEARGPYSRSKVEAEKWVRAVRESGAPVTITYPGGIHGPDSPTLTTGHGATIAWLRFPPRMPGGTCIVDVRDVAAMHTTLLGDDDPPARLMLPGHNLTWDELSAALTRVTGRAPLRVPLPGVAFRFAGLVGDLSQRVWPRESIWSLESMQTATRQPRYDDARTRARYGDGIYRPVDETLRDEIAWLVAAGHLPARLAGAGAT